MAGLSPREMAQQIGTGLLSFPVTFFDGDNRFNEKAYRAHCARMLEKPLAGIFPAGGTGEFFSLSLTEVRDVVSAAVQETAGRIPVIAGCGYGTQIAAELAQAAEQSGADGILLLPPYLISGGQEGFEAHIDAVCKATRLGVIVYNRDNGIIEDEALARLCDRNPNLVGYKDGVGDIELMARIYTRLGDRLTYIGGLPTAETFAAPYLKMGVTTYSSAIFNFLPDWALNFYEAVRAEDQAAVLKGLSEFVMPYIRLRNRGKGYAVSIVKAGMRAVGHDAGHVRTPLSDLNDAEFEALKALIARVQPLTVKEPA